MGVNWQGVNHVGEIVNAVDRYGFELSVQVESRFNVNKVGRCSIDEHGTSKVNWSGVNKYGASEHGMDRVTCHIAGVGVNRYVTCECRTDGDGVKVEVDASGCGQCGWVMSIIEIRVCSCSLHCSSLFLSLCL